MEINLSKNCISDLKQKSLSFSSTDNSWNFVLENTESNYEYITSLLKDPDDGVPIILTLNNNPGDCDFGFDLVEPDENQKTFEIEIKPSYITRLLVLNQPPEKLIKSICYTAESFEDNPKTTKNIIKDDECGFKRLSIDDFYDIINNENFNPRIRTLLSLFLAKTREKNEFLQKFKQEMDELLTY